MQLDIVKQNDEYIIYILDVILTNKTSDLYEIIFNKK